MNNDNSTKTPNQEQLLAIEHVGGKILSAGAGSGKTFVLIEHIIVWLNNLRLNTPRSDWQQVIPFQLPKLVMMTFTKKAAGEMSIRMMKRLDSLCAHAKDSDEQEFWQIVRQYLSMMNITTISSFCHKLISQGYFSELGSDVQVLSSVEYKNKISNLFNLWFIARKSNLNKVFQANSKALINAMIDIFNSPELRLMWKETLIKTSPQEELARFVNELQEKFELNELFNSQIDLEADSKEKTKSWYNFFQLFDQLVQTVGPLSAVNLKEYILWSARAGTLPKEAKAMTENQKITLLKIKSLVKDLREVEDDFINFIDHYDIYWSWVETFKDIYNFIDEHYFHEKGFSFSDLEYYCCQGLRNSIIREKIKADYDYFIIDEFQDTSSVQYEILRHLVGDNHQRFFCVGDKKQAIYGFRGGELLVFNQCAEMLGPENNIWLKNNFRSEAKIINFNNSFFQEVFPLGDGFEGLDANSVEMEEQTIPQNKMEDGLVEKIKTEVTGLESEKKVDVDYYEAQALFEIIKQQLLNDDIKSICVLYRKLRPSSYLLDILTENKISFSAQVKVQYGEDPIINLFLRAIELKLNRDDSKKLMATHFLMKSLLEVLNVEAKIEDIEKMFLGDLATVGLRVAFHKLIFSLGLSNSQYQDNGQLIDSICRVCKEDLLRVFHLLSSESEEEYSLELMNGADSKRVTIMSAHASKGLEFDAVFLGGIHSNGNQMGKTETIGKLPKSFRWKKAYNQKIFYRTPVYHFEAKLDKAKEFSESKRLLYVACTRAVKYLAWVDLWARVEGIEKSLATGSNHWIKAMRVASKNELVNERPLALKAKKTTKDVEVALVLKDSLGLCSLGEKGKLGLFAETSVTKLAQIAQCPFKFYLSNICKINPPEALRSLVSIDDDDSDDVDIFYSSKQRGVKIHSLLSRLLLQEMKISDVDELEREKIQWVLDRALEVSGNKKIISERQIKFSLFGQMISGIPDLIFENENDLIVWDFKTGERVVENEESYWFQLMCYAHAYAKTKHFTPEKMIPLTLVYLDSKQVVTKEVSHREISQILFEKWLKTESLDQVNLKHCSHCEYVSICLHTKRTAH